MTNTPQPPVPAPPAEPWLAQVARRWRSALLEARCSTESRRAAQLLLYLIYASFVADPLPGARPLTPAELAAICAHEQALRELRGLAAGAPVSPDIVDEIAVRCAVAVTSDPPP